MSYAERYRRALEVFGAPVTAEDQVAAEEMSKGASRLGISLPEALCTYYLAVGRHSVNQACDRLLLPDQWYVDQGHLVFIEGHHDTFFWGFALRDTSENPTIWLGSLDEDGIHWDTENGRCADFLVVMMHWQAVSGFMEFVGSANVGSAELGRLQAHWQFVGKVNGGMIAFTHGGDVACVAPGNNADDLEIIAASRTEEAYAVMTENMQALGIALKAY